MTWAAPSPAPPFMTKFLQCMLVLMAVCLSSAALAAPSVSKLEDRLVNGADFRIRVRAALSLGRVSEEKVRARKALEKGLDDANASVRSAAIAALAVLGDKEALPALGKMKDDPSAAVRRQAEAAIASLSKAPRATTTGGVLVETGKFRDATGRPHTRTLSQFRDATVESLGEIEGVEYVPSSQAGERLAQKTGRPRVQVGGWLRELKHAQEGSRAVFIASVEFVVYRMPGHALSGKVKGSARIRCTLDEINDPKKRERVERSVIEAAVGSAMRRAPQAILAATK